MKDITDRVLQLLELLELSPSGFADSIQIPRAIMSHILSRRNKPSLEVVQKILIQYPHINADWLLNNVGEMTQLNMFDNLEVNEQTRPSYAEEKVNIVQEIKEPYTTPNPKSTQSKAKSTVQKKQQLDKNTNNSDSNDSSTIVEESVVQDYEEQATYRRKNKEPKQIEKIIIFYTDKTFAVHLPE